jgi:hypothetical protein
MSAVFPLPARAPKLPSGPNARRAAYELARTIAARPPLGELLSAAVAASRELFEAEEAALLLDEESAAREALARSIVISSAPTISRVSERNRVVYCVPLVVGGEPIGLVRVTNPGGGRPLDDGDLLLLNGIARDLAAALGPAPEKLERAVEPGANLFAREGDFWTVAHAGAVARVKDGKGMRQLAMLLARPGRELHVLDMVASQGPVTRGSAATSDSLLDSQSRREVRGRIAELRDEAEEARAHNDALRAARAETEMDFLLAELGRCVGLGGRPRAAVSDAERARQNVTRSIRAAIRHMASHHAPLARHLERTIRTGVFCSYQPDPRVPTAWEL